MTFAALVFTVASLHVNDSRHYNQINPGLGSEWCCAFSYYVSGGAYVNSSARLSVYATVGKRFLGPRVGVGFHVGGVTGYRYSVLPLAFPYVYVRVGRVDVQVNVLPIRRPVLGFQLRLAY